MSEARPARGRVILVGAGPGDPDLITVRGLKALQTADVVVYDALASSALLELVPASTTLCNVGKRGHDLPTRPPTRQMLKTSSRIRTLRSSGASHRLMVVARPGTGSIG